MLVGSEGYNSMFSFQIITLIIKALLVCLLIYNYVSGPKRLSLLKSFYFLFDLALTTVGAALSTKGE